MSKLWISYAYPQLAESREATPRLLSKATCPCMCLWCHCWKLPSQVEVTIAGLTDGDCTNCTNYNTTFTLDTIHAPPNRDCEWRYDFSPVECNPADYLFCVVEDVDIATATLRVILGEFWNTDRVVEWSKTLTSQGDRDCSDWSGLVCTYDDSDWPDTCDNTSSSTATVSAV